MSVPDGITGIINVVGGRPISIRPIPNTQESSAALEERNRVKIERRFLDFLYRWLAVPPVLDVDGQDSFEWHAAIKEPLAELAGYVHVHAIWTRRNGLCPCCQETPVCGAAGRLDCSEYDHWFCRSKNRVTQTWLICAECNRRLNDTEFKTEARSAFEAYQQALRPFLGRQIPMALFEATGA